jgi:hypothetical protein
VLAHDLQRRRLPGHRLGGLAYLRVQWEPGVVRCYYGGRLVGTVTQGVSPGTMFPGTMFMVFDYTTSGAYPRQVLTSAEMQVDWVRAWAG